MDKEIHIIYHFGGKWVNNDLHMEYVGGTYYQFDVGYDVDCFGFFNINTFYEKLLGLEKCKLWFMEGGLNGEADGILHEIKDDKDVLKMIECNKGHKVSKVYGVEEGDNITNVDKLLRRLRAVIPEDKEDSSSDAEIKEGEWSEDDDNQEEEVKHSHDEGTGEDSDECTGEDNDKDNDRVDDARDNETMPRAGEIASNEAAANSLHPCIRAASQYEIATYVYAADDSDIDEPVIVGDQELYDVEHDFEEEVGDDYPWFNGLVNGLCTGMKFKTVEIYRKALREWCVENNADFVQVKNTKERVTVRCKDRCGFKVHASLKDDTGVFQIKTWRPKHHCVREWNNHLVTSGYIANKYLEDFRDNPDWKVVAIQKTMQKRLSCNISVQQCYRAKRKAKKLIEGDAAAQYSRLRDYAMMVMRTNKGSTMKICTRMGSPGLVKRRNPDGRPRIEVPRDIVPMFLYMYVRFTAQKEAFFAGLRPFVGLDGCFLKGTMGGQLLSAVAKDGNNNMYPLAMAVVDAEDKESWGWFLQNIFDDFGHPKKTKMVFMSDRQKGLQEAMNLYMPGIEHRICVKHLYENFKGTFKGPEYKELLWQAASTGSIHKWQYILELMKKLPGGQNAYNFLMKIDPRSWARSHFSTHCKTDLIVNNISEAFNSAILRGRDMPILSMLEWIRRKLMKRIHVKHANMEKHNGKLCPNIVKELESVILDSRMCFPTAAGLMKFEVDFYGSSHVVDVNARTCTCRMWELNGIPCKHAVAAIYHSRLQPEDYVDNCYSRETYTAVYNHIIVPIPSQDEWPIMDLPNVHPPVIRKPAGRPKKKRKKAADEPRDPSKVSRAGGSVRCGNCKQIGHNSRGCRAAVTGESKRQSKVRVEKLKPKEKGKKSQVDVTVGSQQSQASNVTID